MEKFLNAFNIQTTNTVSLQEYNIAEFIERNILINNYLRSAENPGL